MKSSSDNVFFKKLMIILITSVLSIFLLCIPYVLFVKGLYNKSFCLDAECVDNFLAAYAVIPSTINAVVQFFSYIFAIAGVYFALKTYISNLDALKTNIHLSHQNTFRSYMEMEVSKFDRISGRSLNVFKWYNLAFPDSPAGNINVSQEYISVINEINSNIDDSNNESSLSADGVCFEYRKHQGKMIKTFNKLGIKTSRMPRNNFYEIEGAVLDFIQQVNLEFFRLDPKVCNMMNRRYH